MRTFLHDPKCANQSFLCGFVWLLQCKQLEISSCSELTANGEKRREFDSIKGPVLGELNSNGKVYVTFADSREAQRAVEKIHRVWPEWRIVSLTAREYVQVAEPMLLGRISDYDGQLLVSAFYDGHNPNLNESIVARSVESTIASFGDIKSFKLLCTAQVNICEFHVEFYNSNEADSAASALNGASVDVSYRDLLFS